MSQAETETHYEITVWNTLSGDIERKWWNATEKDLDEAEEQFGDAPWLEVIVEREWEVEI